MQMQLNKYIKNIMNIIAEIKDKIIWSSALMISFIILDNKNGVILTKNNLPRDLFEKK